MDLITPVFFSPLLLLLIVSLTIAIALLLKWKGKNSFWAIFLSTALLSIVVIAISMFIGFNQFQEHIARTYIDASEVNPMLVAGFARAGFYHLLVALAMNAVISWLMRRKTPLVRV